MRRVLPCESAMIHVLKRIKSLHSRQKKENLDIRAKASKLLVMASKLITSDGLQPNSDGLHPTSDGLQPTSDGLQPFSDGLQPTNDALAFQPKNNV